MKHGSVFCDSHLILWFSQLEDFYYLIELSITSPKSFAVRSQRKNLYFAVRGLCSQRNVDCIHSGLILTFTLVIHKHQWVLDLMSFHTAHLPFSLFCQHISFLTHTVDSPLSDNGFWVFLQFAVRGRAMVHIGISEKSGCE